MKNIAPEHMDILDAAAARIQKHRFHMALLETIRGQKSDDYTIVVNTREQSYKTMRFLQNQLRDYEITREYVYPNFVIRLQRK